MKKFFLLLLFLLLFVQLYSQLGIHIKAGASPWHITHNIEKLSSPISLGYTGGLNVEYAFPYTSLGLLSGLDYTYALPGNEYIDASDRESIAAAVYADLVNRQYVDVTRQEFSVPLVLLFYNGGIRTGLGVQYSRYLFDNGTNNSFSTSLHDYGAVAMAGARISKRIVLSLSYYYGLNQPFYGTGETEWGEQLPDYKGRMQHFRVFLCLSLFNNMDDNRSLLGAN